MTEGWAGTRDRSWGIRPVGAAEPQPPPEGNFHQFFWLWTPCNFADRSLFFHSNDDGAGEAWNRRAVLVGSNGSERHFADPAFTAEWRCGTRRLEKLTANLDGRTRLTLTPSGPLFAMSGLGYTHPVWGHGLDHCAELAVAHDRLTEAERSWGNPLAMHVQALVTAELVTATAATSASASSNNLSVRTCRAVSPADGPHRMSFPTSRGDDCGVARRRPGTRKLRGLRRTASAPARCATVTA